MQTTTSTTRRSPVIPGKGPDYGADLTPPSALSEFEAAAIGTGLGAEVVLRRRGPAILTGLDRHARQAVETYAAIAEAVMAGGAAMPRAANLTGGCSGGAPSKDGRQGQAIDQVSFLRKMETAVGGHSFLLGRRDPVAVPVLDLWRAVCLWDVTMEGFLARRGLSNTRTRAAAMRAAFEAAAERVADAIGAGRNPLQKGD